ncbi:O-methyltransferase [Aureococcus anophagefferens]|nr:O-methyltransferase [Aureococcus anophagefferens]
MCALLLRGASAFGLRLAASANFGIGFRREASSKGRAINVVVDAGLRSSLRLDGKYRRARCFLPEGVGLDDEGALRAAVEAAIPPLALADYAVDVEKTAPAAQRPCDETDVVSFHDFARREAPAAAAPVAAEAPVADVAEGASPKGRAVKVVVDAGLRSSLRLVGKHRRARVFLPEGMVSWYHFFEAPLDDGAVDAVVASLAASGAASASPAPRGAGATPSSPVPAPSLDALAAGHARRFAARRGAAAAELRRARLPADFAAPPSRRCTRAAPAVVADDGGAGLDLRDCGDELAPDAWHAALGGDFSGGGGGGGAPVVLDVRNHYESAVGTFAGATALGTETFKDTYAALDGALAGKPKDEPVYMFCTGGIRCVKAGSYVKQALGFEHVKRLEGGVVNYTRHLRENAASLEETSRFRGVNYVFNDRVGEAVTAEAPDLAAAPLDPRAAEAPRRAAAARDDAVDAYAAAHSSREPAVVGRLDQGRTRAKFPTSKARLDALARYPAAAHMCSGHAQGLLLATLCRLVRCESALELGTFCGYGTLWLASATKTRVVTVDRDPRAAVAASHFARAAREEAWAAVVQVDADRADYLASDGRRRAARPHVDCDKKGYAKIFDAILDRGLLKPGGAAVFDNTLWKGKVVDGATGMTPAEEAAVLQRARDDAARDGRDDPERDAKRALKAAKRDRAIQQALHEFNVKLRKDARVDQLLLPLRDGLTVVTRVI